MPSLSRKKGRIFITRALEPEAELNEMKKDLGLGEFAVPIGKLEEEGKTEGAVKRLDEFPVDKAVAKMSDLYSALFADCWSYLDEQHKDAKAKGKMDWTPLPIQAPKTNEEAVKYRRITAKGHATGTTEPTKLYDNIQSSIGVAAKDKTGP
ncbi:hypothetical protein CFIO01_11832 [Colletotrichum fioriniae PJ7]|uniref:Uncharacterized protein n=1 Tax=Colletotrichum fioriniae PJ7 TaxID=1445577 RepID=A0A010QID1_9PEZI|nr:hypothetical protein CFIO01_11832 [Colletotrichum fioriniae PJ7]